VYLVISHRRDIMISTTFASIAAPCSGDTAAEFVAFLTDVVASQSRGKEIHVVADNLTAHRTLKGQRLSPGASNRSLALRFELLSLAKTGGAMVVKN
jgi:hypothetical protein